VGRGEGLVCDTESREWAREYRRAIDRGFGAPGIPGGREAPLRPFASLRSDNSENQQRFVEVAQVARVAALPNAR
jgi:hypothetical protein